MKKLFDLLKTEFIKNLNMKKIIIVLIVLIFSSLIIFKISELSYQGYYSNVWSITKSDIESYEQDYNLSKDLFKQYNNYQTYLEMNKDEKFLNLRKTMYENGFIDPSTNRTDIYNNLISLIPRLSEYEATINGYKENILELSQVNEKYNKLKEEYNTSFEVLKTGNIYELEKLYISNYKEELVQVNNKLKDVIGTDYTLQNKKYYLEEKIKSSEYIINNKITVDDWQYFIIKNIDVNLAICLIEFDTEEMFNENRLNYSQYNSYEDYVNTYQIPINEHIKKVETLRTILDKNIKPIIGSDELSTVEMPYDARVGFNNIYYMGIVVIIICTILLGGIVAKEHNSGSVRLLVANPFKRRKILFAKFIYLILNALFLYIISLLIFIIIMLISGNIDNLFIPQLIIENGVIGQTNYLLFVIKNMGIHFIFITFILTLLFFLSSITLNIAFTVGTTLLVTLLSVFLPVISYQSFGHVFSYIPISFLNYSNYLIQNPTYNLFFTEKINIYSNINLITCILMTVISILVILVITNIIYSKRDIKN